MLMLIIIIWYNITTSFSSMIKVVGALPTVQVVPGVVLLAEKIENINENIK